MLEGTERSMENSARIANSNHTMASDMVDYTLDRQTVRDVNTEKRERFRTRQRRADLCRKYMGTERRFSKVCWEERSFRRRT